MPTMKIVDYAIHVNCIEDTQCELKTIILVLKRFMPLILEVSSIPVVNMRNCGHWEGNYPGIITKNHKRDFSLFFSDKNRRGFKLLWEEEPCRALNCYGKKNLFGASIAGIIRVLFLRSHCEDTSYCDYKPNDFYLAVTESDFS